MKKSSLVMAAWINVLILALLFSSGFSFAVQDEIKQPVIISATDLTIDTVDGEIYQPAHHKQIAGVVFIYQHGKVKGMAFSTHARFQTYLQNQPIKENSAASKTQRFYEHATWDRNGGAYRTLSAGTQVKRVTDRWGRSWNDRISAIGTDTRTWTTLYEHDDYRGCAGRFVNNSNRDYVIWNLPRFELCNSGKTWNDQTSSIRTGHQ